MITISQGLFAGGAVAYSAERNHKEPTWAITALQANQLFLLIGATFAQAGIASAAFRLLARVTFFVTPFVMVGQALRPTPSDLEKKWIQRLNYGYLVTAAVTSIALTALGGTALGMGVLTVLAVKALFELRKEQFPAKLRDGFAFATKIGAGLAALGYGHLTLQRDVEYPFAFLATALFFGLAEYMSRPRGGEQGGRAEGAGEEPGAQPGGGGEGAAEPLPQYQPLLDPQPPAVVVRQPVSQSQPQVVVMAAPPAPPSVVYVSAPQPVAYPVAPYAQPTAAYVPFGAPATVPHRRPRPASLPPATSALSTDDNLFSAALPMFGSSAPAARPAPSAPPAPATYRAPAPAPKQPPAASRNAFSAPLPF